MAVVRPAVGEPAVNGSGLRTADVEVRLPVAILSAGPHRPDVAARAEELERQGQPVMLVCLDGARHEHEHTRADVLHLPLLSGGILSSVAARLTRNPGRVLRMVMRLLGAPSALLRFPVAVHLARVLPQRGIADLQSSDPMAARLASVVRQLGELTPPDFAALPVDWTRLGARRIGVRWFTQRINSIVAEVSLDGDRRVIVKRQRTHAGGTAADRWAHEYRVLSSLAEAMGDGLLTVPRVLLFDEEAATLVMERAPGTALDALFAAAAADQDRMERLAEGIRGAGAWLAAMQAATPGNRDGRALLAELAASAIEDTAKLAARDPAIRRHQRSIVHNLQSLERRLSGGPLTVAGHHDDYWPGNIFFDGSRVAAIDFESFRDGLPLEDAAYFLIRSDMLRRRFRLRLPNLAQRFFEGYCPGQQPDPEALRLFTLTKGLRSLARGVGEDLPMPQRIWTRRTIRAAVLSAIGDRR
ncbi:MAG TPA: phosphotransferase [Thermoanaerobaculia bacterium]|nr:phosphotransferase [Thermoanaerobaculia bacterium]